MRPGKESVRQGLRRLGLQVEILESRSCPSGFSANWAASPDETGPSILVTTRSPRPLEIPPTLAPKVTALQALGAGVYQIQLQPQVPVAQAVSLFRQVPSVSLVEPNYPLRLAAIPNDPMWSGQWSLANTLSPGADIRAPAAWDRNTEASSIVVAVIDTGVDYNHPDLRNNIWRNEAEIPNNGLDDDGNGYVDDSLGYDFVNNDPNPWDDHGHGTHVAGIIGAEGNNGLGITGVAWKTRLMVLKSLRNDGTGTVADAVRAIDYAIRMGARIINASWGGPVSSSILAQAVARAEQAGVLFVAAAGNDGTNNDVQPHYPSSYAYANILAVAATDPQDRLADFSNYGANTVHLAAPGVAILSTLPHSLYGYLSGSSMAAPHVSGAAALVWALHPDWNFRQIKARLLRSVDALAPLQGMVASQGRLNLARALEDSFDRDLTGPRVLRLQWLRDQNGLFGFEVAFNEIIASLPAAALTINGPQGQALRVTSVRRLGNGGMGSVFEVRFTTQTLPGNYTATIGPGICDLAGNPMDQNGDGLGGQVPQDRFVAQTTWNRIYTFRSGVVNATIADLSSVSVPLNVSNSVVISEVQVVLQIQHTWTSDLIVSLISPSGRVVTLVHRRGGAGRDFQQTWFSDHASVPISAALAPFRGTYRPEQGLSSLRGTVAAGTWTLRVQDVARGDTGRVVQWGLVIEAQPAGTSASSRPASPASPTASSPSSRLRIAGASSEPGAALADMRAAHDTLVPATSGSSPRANGDFVPETVPSGAVIPALTTRLNLIAAPVVSAWPQGQLLQVSDTDLATYYLAQLSLQQRRPS
ncbi:MAG: S8 family serine peptidase [Gemmatales bacterium]|nr:S8 family serine peptidase [Gemmatales bacterium]